MLFSLFFLVTIPSSCYCGKCANCINRGEVYCVTSDDCGIFPYCFRWVKQVLNCPDYRNITVAYDEIFARTIMLKIAAASYSDDPSTCLRNSFPGIHLINDYSIECSYHEDSIAHIAYSWLGYFLDRINLINYVPPPIFSSDCSGFIATYDEKKAIVMSFRGTEGLFQLLEQVLQYHRGMKDFFDSGSIYGYFYNAFNMMWAGGMEEDVRKVLIDKSDYELWITGFSLGGSIASVTASYIAKLGLLDPSRIKLVTFGQPRTGDYDFAAWHDRTFPYSFRVVNGRDPVPHLPPRIGPFVLFHHGVEIWYQTEMWPLSNYKVCIESDGQQCSNKVILYNIIDHMYYFETNVSDLGKYACIIK